jgi:hypothetical protein
MKLPRAPEIDPSKVSIPDDVFVEMEEAGKVKLNARHRARCRKILSQYWGIYSALLKAPTPEEKLQRAKWTFLLSETVSLLSENGRYGQLLFIKAKVDIDEELERLESLLRAGLVMIAQSSKGGRKPKTICALLLEPLQAVFQQAGGGSKFMAFAWVAIDKCFPRHVENKDALWKQWLRYKKARRGKSVQN